VRSAEVLVEAIRNDRRPRQDADPPGVRERDRRLPLAIAVRPMPSYTSWPSRTAADDVPATVANPRTPLRAQCGLLAVTVYPDGGGRDASPCSSTPSARSGGVEQTPRPIRRPSARCRRTPAVRVGHRTGRVPFSKRNPVADPEKSDIGSNRAGSIAARPVRTHSTCPPGQHDRGRLPGQQVTPPTSSAVPPRSRPSPPGSAARSAWAYWAP